MPYRHRPLPFALLLPLLAALLVAAPDPARSAAGAQDSSPQDPSPRDPSLPGAFQGEAEVTVVEIPVQVTRGGEPVRGLTAADFRVLVGKQPQPIVGFEVVDLALLAPGTSNAPTVTSLPISGRRHFLFLFDLSNSDPHSLGRAQQAAIDVVRTSLTPADVAAVATYSPLRGATVLLAFTSDRRQLELALDTLGSTELIDRRSDFLGIVLGEIKEQVESANANVHTGFVGRGTEAGADVVAPRVAALAEVLNDAKDLDALQARELAQAEADRASAMARGLADLGTLMQRVDGRKHVVLFSTGFSNVALLGDQSRASRPITDEEEQRAGLWRTGTDDRFGNSRLHTVLRQALEEMRRADCVIHAVDIGGIEAGTRAIAGDVGEVHAAAVGTTRADDSLFVFAEETGGQLYRNFNDLGAAVDKVLAATAVTYVLTIEAPPGLGYVPLKVEVQGQRGAAVSHRPGFFATPSTSAQNSLAERLELGSRVLAGKAGGDLRCSLVALPVGQGGAVEAILGVSGEDLLVDNVGDLVASEITFYAFAADGSIAAVKRQATGFDLRRVGDRLRQGGVKVFADMTLQPGNYDVRVLVRNPVTGRWGIATAAVSVAASPPLLTGVFVEPQRPEWLLLRSGEGGEISAYPFLLGERVLVPNAARLRAGEPATFWLEAVGEGGAELAAAVHRADGSLVGPSVVEVEERAASPTGERLLARFAPAGLTPGSYRLEVRLAAAAGPITASLPFTVE